MSDFQFFEWERLSEDVTDGEADLRLLIWGKEWLFRGIGVWLFARCAQGRENFVVTLASAARELQASQPIYHPVAFQCNAASTLAWVRQAATSPEEDALQNQRLFRFWKMDARCAVLNNGLHWFVVPLPVSNPTYNSIFRRFLPVGGKLRSILMFPFRFAVPDDASSAQALEQLKAEWQNVESELRFAARFVCLPDDECALLGVQTRIGTPQEFARLIQSALRAFGSQWPAEVETASLSFCAEWRLEHFVLKEKHPFGTDESAILNHIIRAFEPRQLADSPDLPLCVQALTEGDWSRSFSIEVARPSMNDRLQGMLELRSWLETHWPDGVKHLGKVV